MELVTLALIVAVIIGIAQASGAIARGECKWQQKQDKEPPHDA